MFNIVLVHPQIPQNTGSIGRMCVNANLRLHIIKPTVFDISEKAVRRAGLDYWHLVDIVYHDSFAILWQKYQGSPFYFFSTKAPRIYTEAQFTPEDFLVFGKETAGIPEELLKAHWECCLRIPMMTESRSLNLANAVAVASYEALRQNRFEGLQRRGFDHLD